MTKYKDRGWLYDQLLVEQRTQTDVADQFDVSRATITYWREKLGIPCEIPDEVLKNALIAEDEKYDRPITLGQYKSGENEPSATMIKRRFGSWNEAKEKAGLETNKKTGSPSTKVDKAYFDEIDTVDKAYWIGFILGDGYIGKNESGTPYLEVRLHRRDRSHLVKLSDSINCGNDVYDGNDDCVGLKITNQGFCDNLIEKGIHNEKTNSSDLPDISVDLTPHFIRGLVDADGHINTDQYRVVITGASKDRLRELGTWIPFITSLASIENCFQIRFGMKSNFDEVIDYLYPNSDTTVPSLERKKDSAISAKMKMVSDSQ